MATNSEHSMLRGQEAGAVLLLAVFSKPAHGLSMELLLSVGMRQCYFMHPTRAWGGWDNFGQLSWWNSVWKCKLPISMLRWKNNWLRTLPHQGAGLAALEPLWTWTWKLVPQVNELGLLFFSPFAHLFCYASVSRDFHQSFDYLPFACSWLLKWWQHG